MTLQRRHHLWVAAADSSMWIVCGGVFVIYLATTGGVRTQHSNWTYDRNLWLRKHTNMSTCTFFTQMPRPGSPGSFGKHLELCSQGSSSLYPPVFVEVLLNKSIRTRRHRVWLPSVGTQMAWPGFQTYTHYDWLVQVLMIQTQQGFQAVWTGTLLRVDEAGQRGKINGEELPGGESFSWREKHHKTDWLI